MALPTLDGYLNLVTSQYRNSPNFIAFLSVFIEAQMVIQEILASLSTKIDVDFAVGEQLDFVGQWVGISRNVNIPVTGLYFAWDDPDPNLGWDIGIWQGNADPSTITVLPDEQYRTLIRAKIATNRWDGTTEGMYDVWEQVFPDLNILIFDHQDMSYDIAIEGGIIDGLTKALIVGGYFPLKPEGVRISGYYFATTDLPLFGWNLDTDFVKGWNEGAYVDLTLPPP